MSKFGMLVVGFMWLSITAAGVMGYRWFLVPYQQEKAKQELLEGTSAQPHYESQITIGFPNSDGHRILSSDDFRSYMNSYGVGVSHSSFVAGNPAHRLSSLQTGELDFGVFTIAELIRFSEEIDELPGVILFATNESQGVDTIVGKDQSELKKDSTRFLVMDDSSDVLARLVSSYFNVRGNNQFVRSDRLDKSSNYVFAVKDPSEIIKDPEYKILIDSSKFRGYMLEVLVVSRRFLAEHPETAKQVAESYFRSLFKSTEALVADKGVWWKNTRENYAHFGIQPGTDLPHIENIVANVTDLLKKTNAIKKDPTNGSPHLLYYDGILQQMRDSSFHPGVHVGDDESIRSEVMKLSDEEWQKLEPVGLAVQSVVFAPGLSNLTDSGKSKLNELSAKLAEAPQFYLLVHGNANPTGDPELNKNLMLARAKSVKEYLDSKGVSSDRMRVTETTSSTGSNVTFTVAQLPY